MERNGEFDVSKKFWAFAYNDYPAGGMWDFYGSADTKEEAMQLIKNVYQEWSIPDNVEIYENVDGKLIMR